MNRPVQYFDAAYLQRCQDMSHDQIAAFLYSFARMTTARAVKRPKKLISLRVDEDLLLVFRQRCEREGVAYQTQIQRLMAEWTDGNLE